MAGKQSRRSTASRTSKEPKRVEEKRRIKDLKPDDPGAGRVRGGVGDVEPNRR